MLPLSTSYIEAKNKLEDTYEWLTLVKVEFSSDPADTLRLVASTVDIVWNAETWSAYPFEVDTINEGMKGEVQRVTIKMSNVNQMAHFLAEKYSGGVGSPVSFYIVYTGDLAETTTIPILTFKIMGCDITTKDVVFTLGEESPYQKRDPQDRMYKNFCRFRFPNSLDERCPYTAGVFTTCNHTLANCEERNGDDSKFCGIFPMIGRNVLYV